MIRSAEGNRKATNRRVNYGRAGAFLLVAVSKINGCIRPGGGNCIVHCKSAAARSRLEPRVHYLEYGLAKFSLGTLILQCVTD